MDTPDLKSSLVVGSVTTTQGTVLMGNGPSDASVEVNLGALGFGGESVEIVFDVLVNDPFPPGILMIANQGEVSGSNFDPVPTDDPSTPAFPDPTMTEIANTKLDICEREFEECLDVPTFADADGDGEYDGTDRCPMTAPGAIVDDSGCSLDQFCGAIAIDGRHQRVHCTFADWMNDQLFGPPRDCRVERLGRHEWLCVAR